VARKAANKALHRIPYAVVLFAKTRKKSRQHTPPVNAALGNEYMSIHDILTEFRGKNVQTGTCSKEAYVPID